jgi:large subunit ribosomal protein L24
MGLALRHLSKKPSKARKAHFQAPLHRRSKRVRAPLSEELREKYRVRNVRVRVGDGVRVLRGEFKGVEGKVTRVFTDSGRLAIEGVTRPKIRGGTVPVKIHASKVLVTSLNLEDARRRRRLEAGVSEA